ncbi:hypothetical protein FB45DRAFT_962901 [Roridomyces roridus]|uniref:Uncharacterized protein n=1 Tax=Roridomyces roridus TaxID=1738132 RepID=A0AAD7AXG7_9AGAR|nr:hypothetical protein FB45DRAFT_962901 [Roridomyces roridus]
MPAVSLPSAHSLNNPHRPTQPVRKRGTTSDAQKGSGSISYAQKLDKQAAIARLMGIFKDRREEIVEDLVRECGLKRDVALAMLTNKSTAVASRAPNLYNALVHDIRIKDEEAGRRSRHLKQIQEEISTRMEEKGVNTVESLLTTAEKERILEQLREDRHVKVTGVRATLKSVGTDSTKTIQGMGDEAKNLFERTAVAGFGVFAGTNADDMTPPHCFDSGDSLDFFPEVLGITPVEVLRKYVAWLSNRAGAGTERKTGTQLRKGCVQMMESSLRRITKDPTARMSFTNYDVDIRAARKVELRGWLPGIPFTNFSEISQMADLRRLHDALRAGEIYWRCMTQEAVKELNAELDERRKEGPLKKRKQRDDAGKPRGPRRRKDGGDDSRRKDGNDEPSDSDDDDEGDEDQQPAKKTSKTQPPAQRTHLHRPGSRPALPADRVVVNDDPAPPASTATGSIPATESATLVTVPTTLVPATPATVVVAANTETVVSSAVHVAPAPLGVGGFARFAVNAGGEVGQTVVAKPRAPRKEKRKRDELENDSNAPGQDGEKQVAKKRKTGGASAGGKTGGKANGKNKSADGAQPTRRSTRGATRTAA